MFKVIVWEKTIGSCMPCKLTKDRLSGAGVQFETRPIEDMPTAELEELKTAGHLAAPIVVGPTGVFSSFRPERIRELIATVTTPVEAHAAA